jgi:hypothetical protein
MVKNVISYGENMKISDIKNRDFCTYFGINVLVMGSGA